MYKQMKKQNNNHSCSTALNHCLYFTVNSLVRTINRLAEEEFMPTGLAPSIAFIQMIVNKNTGIAQNEIAKRMNLAPSTITRFIDKLERRGMIVRVMKGKISHISPTPEGLELQPVIEKAWTALFERYSEILGDDFVQCLTEDICQANCMLDEQ